MGHLQQADRVNEDPCRSARTVRLSNDLLALNRILNKLTHSFIHCSHCALTFDCRSLFSFFTSSRPHGEPCGGSCPGGFRSIALRSIGAETHRDMIMLRQHSKAAEKFRICSIAIASARRRQSKPLLICPHLRAGPSPTIINVRLRQAQFWSSAARHFINSQTQVAREIPSRYKP